jgi:hypothetical protein
VLQGDAMEKVQLENVHVQLNPQVIIQAGDHQGVTSLEHAGLTIQLPEGLHSEQGFFFIVMHFANSVRKLFQGFFFLGLKVPVDFT